MIARPTASPSPRMPPRRARAPWRVCWRTVGTIAPCSVAGSLLVGVDGGPATFADCDVAGFWRDCAGFGVAGPAARERNEAARTTCFGGCPLVVVAHHTMRDYAGNVSAKNEP